MIAITKLLVATDFSEHSKNALKYGAELAKLFHAELILLHTVESDVILSQIPPGGEAYFPPNLVELQTKESEKICAEWLAEEKLENSRVLVRQGTPMLEIIRAARDEDVDLLVLGTHGRGAIAHVLLGSVAERVVRKAPCPVLTVRSGEHEFVHP